MTVDSSLAALRLACSSRRQFLGVAGAGLLSTSLPTHGAANSSGANSSYERTIEWGRRAIEKVMHERPDAAAISVALLKDERMVWQQAFGKASVATNTPATIRTRFNIGSVSKVFAGLAGVILEDRGLVNLDTPIVRYLPSFRMLSPEYVNITSRQLLSHSSGLPGTNGRNLFTFVPVPGYSADTEAELANAHLKHLPGQLACYNNDGFTMFERVVLAVTGQEYPDFVEEHILKPLNMKDSGFLRAPQLQGEFAHPQYEGKSYSPEFVNAFATGGLSSTPSDMMNLARMFLDKGVFEGRRVVSAAGIAAMAADQTVGLPINPSPEWRWGLGWDSVKQPGLAAANIPAWEKNGGTAFFATEFFVLPEARMGLLITGNSAYGGHALALAEGILTEALKEEGTLSAPPAKVSRVVPPLAAAPSAKQFAGIYGNYKAPLKVSFARDGSLELREWRKGKWAPLIEGASRYRLREDGWWWSENGALPSFRFTEASGADKSGREYRYRYLVERVVAGSGLERITLPIGQQLAPLPKLSSAWMARMKSTWRPTNETEKSAVWMLAGDLRAHLGTLPELPGYILFGGNDLGYQLLTPLSDDRAGPSVKVPVNHGRDLNEIYFATHHGVKVLRTGSLVFVPS